MRKPVQLEAHDPCKILFIKIRGYSEQQKRNQLTKSSAKMINSITKLQVYELMEFQMKFFLY